MSKAPWRLRVERLDGSVVVQEADPALPDPPVNPDRVLYENRDGEVDAAYPVLPSVSYKPLGYLREGTWRAVRAVAAVRLQSTIIAEGVETAHEFNVVQSLGIDAAQGYLFGRPTDDWQQWNAGWHMSLRSAPGGAQDCDALEVAAANHEQRGRRPGH